MSCSRCRPPTEANGPRPAGTSPRQAARGRLAGAARGESVIRSHCSHLRCEEEGENESTTWLRAHWANPSCSERGGGFWGANQRRLLHFRLPRFDQSQRKCRSARIDKNAGRLEEAYPRRFSSESRCVARADSGRPGQVCARCGRARCSRRRSGRTREGWGSRRDRSSVVPVPARFSSPITSALQIRRPDVKAGADGEQKKGGEEPAAERSGLR
jgi:hypothetical protein